MRFTKKSGYHYYSYGIKEKENKNGSKRQYGNPITKLGQLEDIEEKHNIKSIDDLDKRLTALEIIREKGIDILEFRATRKAKTYNEHTKRVYVKNYTDEEYDLLKEALL